MEKSRHLTSFGFTFRDLITRKLQGGGHPMPPLTEIRLMYSFIDGLNVVTESNLTLELGLLMVRFVSIVPPRPSPT